MKTYIILGMIAALAACGDKAKESALTNATALKPDMSSKPPEPREPKPSDLGGGLAHDAAQAAKDHNDRAEHASDADSGSKPEKPPKDPKPGN